MVDRGLDFRRIQLVGFASARDDVDGDLRHLADFFLGRHLFQERIGPVIDGLIAALRTECGCASRSNRDEASSGDGGTCHGAIICPLPAYFMGSRSMHWRYSTSTATLCGWTRFIRKTSGIMARKTRASIQNTSTNAFIMACCCTM